MNKIQFKITGRIPSKKNSKNIIRRGRRSFLIPSNNHTAWENEHLYELREMVRDEIYPLQKVSQIKLHFIFPDKRVADLTNKAESIMDLLVKAGVISDDSWKVVPMLILSAGGSDPTNAGCEVMIEF